MVISSIKSVPGIPLLNHIAGIISDLFSGSGIALTQSPHMVIVITSKIIVDTLVVKTVESDQLE